MSAEQVTIIGLVAASLGAALWTAVTSRLLRAAVGLALTSAVLAIIMFKLDATIAAVFELSVCAGLIPAIFLSAISVTRRVAPEAIQENKKSHVRKFWPLPILVAVAGFALAQVNFVDLAAGIATVRHNEIREVLWNNRHMELLGQIVVLLTGAMGVAVLLKESKSE